MRNLDVPSMVACSMGFDAARGTLVLTGPDGVYELRQGAWRRLPGRPPSAQFAAFATAAPQRWLALESTNGQPRLWRGDALQWEELAVAGGPGLPRYAAFDSSRNEIVTFGGYDPAQPIGTWTFDQTWVFDGVAWQRRLPTTVPPAGGYGALVYDAVRQRTVLAQGQIGGLLQTWEWDGSAWSAIATAAAPPTRSGASIAFDQSRGRTLLVGGNDANGPLADCWEYDGTTWQQVASLPGAARSFAAIAHDPGLGGILVLGGFDGTFELQDAWLWDGLAWTPGPAFGPAPTATYGGTVAIEPTGPSGAGVLYFGGGNPTRFPTYSSETWRWDGSAWAQLPAPGLVLMPTFPAPLGSGLQGALLWSQQAAMHLLFGYTIAEQSYNVPVVGYPHSMSTWNGSAWSPTPVSSLPPVRRFAALAVDTARNEAVLFGGTPATGALLSDTWVFDGSQWLQRTPAASPSARSGHTMAYDAGRNRTVLFGGYDSQGTCSDTWEWNGSSWTQVATAHLPPQGSATFDAIRQRVLLLADPVSLPAGTAAAWTYDGVDWSGVVDTGPALGGRALGTFGQDVLVEQAGRLYAYRFGDARVEAFGTACSADAALLTTNRLPELGAADFTVELSHAPGSSIALVVGAVGVLPVPVPVLGCTLLVDSTQAVVLLATDARGRAGAVVPVPNLVALLSVELGFQGATFAPLAPQGIALTRGVRARLGR
ncbi:MAG: hypothetical protein KA020_05125 [Planctomycetes bacterium]|nr:hypothetical protein [Planctomycetota bacterium]MCC7063461.1 hypothetical protein [Planctomycetota bacterium]